MFDVDFSYCWLNLEVSWYSLEQYIGCIIRQAFNYYCSLLQVWREAEKQVLIWDLEAKEVLKVLNLIVIGSLRSVKVLKVLTLIRWKMWKVLMCQPKKWKGVR